MQTLFDPFRPRTPEAAAIYDAFQAEASRRKQRPGLTWIENERQAVFQAACDQARLRGWPQPTLKAVETAERCACGHVDYGMKWALYLVESMKREAAS